MNLVALDLYWSNDVIILATNESKKQRECQQALVIILSSNSFYSDSALARSKLSRPPV